MTSTTPASRRPFTITKFRTDPAGFHRARVTAADGTGVDVDDRFGSWQADVRRARGHRTFVRREVLPHVAAALAEKARRHDAALAEGQA